MEYLLRAWQTEDAPALARTVNNQQLQNNLRDGLPFPYTPADAREYIESCLAENPESQINRAIVIDGEAAGSIGVFVQKNIYRKSAEIGYYLARPYWGRGVMTAAVKQLCGEAFERLDIIRIFAEPFAHNSGSRRVLEKSGFLLEGIMRSGAVKNGVLIDYCMYALLRADWKQ